MCEAEETVESTEEGLESSEEEVADEPATESVDV